MVKKTDRKMERRRRHIRVRRKISGTAERPRLCIYRSNSNIYVQIIDDVAGKTLVQASTLDKEIKTKYANKEAAKEVGTLIAKRAADVIDKKMKLINKQIEENGTKLANEAVMEAKSDKEMMLRIREENAKNLIFDFAEQLISENEEYLGKDISEDAKVKVRRKKKEATEGGNENETNEKTKATRGRRPSSGNERADGRVQTLEFIQ